MGAPSGGMGGLFAGGMPKLKSAGDRSRMGTGGTNFVATLLSYTEKSALS